MLIPEAETYNMSTMYTGLDNALIMYTTKNLRKCFIIERELKRLMVAANQEARFANGGSVGETIFVF